MVPSTAKGPMTSTNLATSSTFLGKKMAAGVRSLSRHDRYDLFNFLHSSVPARSSCPPEKDFAMVSIAEDVIANAC